MGSVKLRINLIIDKVGIPFGTIIDEQKLPLHFRKRKYIVRPGEPDWDSKRLKMQEEAVNMDLEPIIDEGEEPTQEERQRIIIANKRGRIRED